MFKFRTTYQTDVWINPAAVMMLEPYSANKMHTMIYMLLSYQKKLVSQKRMKSTNHVLGCFRSLGKQYHPSSLY